MKEFIYFEVEFEDDIGNCVPGRAAIPFNEIVDKLDNLGFNVKKKSKRKKVTTM